MIVPSAPESGTSRFAVTENDLFLIETTLFSDSRPIPANRSWELPLMRVGRPAIGHRSLDAPVVERQHVVPGGLDQPLALQLVELVRHLLRQVVRLCPVLAAVVQLPHVVIECRSCLAGHEPRRKVLCHCAPAL